MHAIDTMLRDVVRGMHACLCMYVYTYVCMYVCVHVCVYEEMRGMPTLSEYTCTQGDFCT